jgi:GNAT superfamily N-acetyltransferase
VGRTSLRRVPIVTDPSRPDWRRLLDDEGHTLASFLYLHRDGGPMADLVETDAAVEEVAERMVRELSGWKVAGEPALGEALVDRGARPTRHAHVHSRDLRAHPAGEPRDPPPGVTIGPLDRDADALEGVYRAAYPEDHVDWTYTGPPADFRRDLAGILDGTIAGPRLDVSRLALDARGEPAGVLIATRLEGEPPFGGPWVAELFRRPGDDVRGAGRALLEAGLHAATQAGLPALGLAVTDGNPAQRLYEALGFERVLSSLVVVLSRDA